MTDRYPEPLSVDTHLDVLERVVAQRRTVTRRIYVGHPFPDALALALKYARMSQSELARRVGCGRASISAYLRGMDTPRRDRLEKINEVLGTELHVARAIRVREVARAMGMGEHKLRKAMRDGAGRLKEIGVVIPSKSGKRCRTYFFPAEVERLVGIDC
jgi:transcriptional regulator with XRE-family HTH domain